MSKEEKAQREALGPFLNRAPTNAEKGALLIAVGKQMIQRDLMAGAALDGNSDEQLVKTMMENGMGGALAKSILLLDLGLFVEAVDGNI